MSSLISTKNNVFKQLVGPSETGKWRPVHTWLKIGDFQTKFKKIQFF